MFLWLISGLILLLILGYGVWQLLNERPPHLPATKRTVMTGQVARQRYPSPATTTIRSTPIRDEVPGGGAGIQSPSSPSLKPALRPSTPAQRIERSHYVESFESGSSPTRDTTTQKEPSTSLPFSSPPEAQYSHPTTSSSDRSPPSHTAPIYHISSSEKRHGKLQVYNVPAPGAHHDYHHEGLTKMRKREPVFEEPRPVERLPSPEKPPIVEEKKPQEEPPGIDIKASFGNPLTMKISYKDDYMLLALAWPKNDPMWVPRIERRVETLSVDSARSSYLYQDKFYLDRPDWGYRIIFSVPSSGLWHPDWKIKEKDRAQGEASPIPFPASPTPVLTPNPSTSPAASPSNGWVQTPPLVHAPTEPLLHPEPEQNAPQPKPLLPPVAAPTQATTISSPKTTFSFTPPTTSPKVSAPLPTQPTVPTGGFVKIHMAPSGVDQSPHPNKLPPSISSTTTEPVKPSFATPFSTLTSPAKQPASPVAPQPTKAQPAASVASATPSKDVSSILQTQLSSQIQSWVPKALTTLPPSARDDLVVPGPGISTSAWDDYVHVMDEFKKYQKLMTPEHPEAKKIEEDIRDASNKIGATAASFREKLGDEGLDGLFTDLKERKLMGVYYYALERFAAKVFIEAAMNKVLESESNAIKYGERVVFMLQRHPLLEVFMKWWIFTKCPFAIPIYPQRRPGQDEETYKKKELGLKDVELDNLTDYLKRTRRFMYLYAAIMNTAPPGAPNPMGIDSAWRFIARTLALPRTEISLWYLEPVINICTRRLMYAYGLQWEKLAAKIMQFVSEPPTGLKFFESTPFISSIRVSLELPTAHTPIQHMPEHESLMELKSKYSYKMEFEEGRFATPEQLDIIFMMVDAYTDYLENHVGDVVDDIMLELKHWRELEDRYSEGKLVEKEGAPRSFNRNSSSRGRGGYSGRGGGRGGGYSGRGR